MSKNRVLDEHITNIIQHHEVTEQSDLQKMLKEIGFDIPQATLSRRLKKLKIAKVSGIYKIIDFSIPNLPIILNIQVSEFGLIVLQTHPGNANSIASFLDQKYVTYNQKKPKNYGILGTIAGDDTILVIVKSKHDINSVLNTLQADFPYLAIPKKL